MDAQVAGDERDGVRIPLAVFLGEGEEGGFAFVALFRQSAQAASQIRDFSIEGVILSG